jgi:ATP-binding cassette subfamily B protein
LVKTVQHFAQQVRRAFSLWARLLALFWNSHPWYVTWLLLITIITGLIPSLQIQVTTQIIQNAALAVEQGQASHLVRQALLFGVLQGGLAIVFALLDLAQQQLQTLLQTRLVNAIGLVMAKKAITLEVEHFENHAFQNTLQRAATESGYRPYGIFWMLVNTCSQLVRTVSVVLVLFSWNHVLGLLLLLAPLPSLATRIIFGQRRYKMERERTQQERLLRYVHNLPTNIEAAKELRLFRLGEHFVRQYQRLSEQFYQADSNLARREAQAQAPFTVLTNAVSAGAQIFAIGLTIATEQIGLLAGYMQAIAIVQSSVEALSWSVSEFYVNYLYLGNLFEFLDFSPRPLPQGTHLVPERLSQGIEFRGVSFKYPGTEEMVLKNLNLFLKAGECIALVGQNGAGKTTLVKLLTRLYEPTEGQILLDGMPLETYDLQDVRRHMSVIFQDFMQYPMTVRENVGFGYIEELENEERIHHAARLSGAEQMIETELPQQYETLLGRLFENGKELSVGQWQKIALARAFMRSAPVVVLDEPTSSIDAEAEAEIFGHLQEIAAGATTLLIAHRFSTVRMADRILVIKHGQIIEDGTHQELLALDGTYAHLFRLQAAGYLDL